MTKAKHAALGLSLATLLIGAVVPGPASAQTPGYVTDAGTENVVRDNFDECWKTSSWTEDKAICECGAMIDSDGDGVSDCEDKCPGTPAGVEVDANGCPIDSDGDGVPDYLDKCPGTPAGVEVDADGCPLDSDGDGVPDYLDKCPGTPAGAPVDENGCQIDETIVISAEAVLFAFDSDTVSDSFKAALDEEIPHLRDNPKVVSIVVEGHTDSTGPAAYNQGLSERRANAVRDYLVAEGVEAEKITTVGKGEEEPVADNSTAEGRALNRRVELDVDVE
jgi:OOP family OmpA-OmpF porin